MKKILYVSSMAFSPEVKGGSVVARRNYDLMCEYFGVDNVFPFGLDCFSLKNKSAIMKLKAIVLAFYNLICLRGNGCSKQVEDSIIKFVVEKDIDVVFVESSLNGRLIRRIKKDCDIVVLSYFHNCEAVLLLKIKNFMNLVRFPFVFLSEKLSCLYSDYIITLSSRDDLDVRRLYKRCSNFIYPITMCGNALDTTDQKGVPYCLFVGSDFMPNNLGISWFIQNVSTKIPFDTYVIGDCCKYLTQSIQIPTCVHLLGKVDDIRDYYINASCVIIPVFYGSGMKTKTIEAMSYGKTIFGTSEAFVGIDADFTQVGGLCNTADEFVKCISNSFVRLTNDYVLNFFRYNFDTNSMKIKFFGFLDDAFKDF